MKDNIWKRLILAFYVPSALIAVAYAVLTPVLPIYASDLSAGYLVVGIILAAESIGRVFGSIPSSFVLRRFGVKNTMIVSLIVAIIPMFLLLFVDSVFLIVALLFISGLGNTSYNISRHAYITIVIKPGIRGRAISLLGGVFRMGSFIGPIIGGTISNTYGLRSGFAVFTIIALICLFFVWRFMRNLDADDSAMISSTARGSFREMLRKERRIFLSAGSGQVLAQLTRQGWKVLIPLYGADVLGLDVQTIGYNSGHRCAV